MRTLPAVAGVLTLAFGLVAFLSVVRRTQTHVYRSAHGESDFAIDVPRGWTGNDVGTTGIEHIRGLLPSGHEAGFYLQAHLEEKPGDTRSIPWVEYPPQESLQELSFEDGWGRRLTRHLRSPPDGRRRFDGVVGRIDRGGRAFTALAASIDPRLTDEDYEQLARYASTLRWIGK